MGKSKKSQIKKKEKPARLERRVRVTFFLPAGTIGDISAVREVIDSLDNQYISDTITKFTVTGFTHSSVPLETSAEETLDHAKRLQEEIFWGHWWSSAETEGVKGVLKKLVIESIVFFLIDYPVFSQEWEIDEVLQNLKEEIFSIYAEYGRPQEEIWIVKQDIFRYS